MGYIIKKLNVESQTFEFLSKKFEIINGTITIKRDDRRFVIGGNITHKLTKNLT